MSYLLMQILLCLIIAGLLGMVIGWMLRGGCKSKLLENDDRWNEKLKSTDSSWEHKVHGIMQKNDKDSERVTLEISTLKNQLDREGQNLADSNMRLAESNSQLSRLKMLSEKEKQALELELVTHKDKLRKDSALQSEVSILESRLKEAESLVNKRDGRVIVLQDELSLVKGELGSMQDKNKELAVELEGSGSDISSLREKLQFVESSTEEVDKLEGQWITKLDDVNAVWEKKSNDTQMEYTNKVDALNYKITELTDELEKERSQNKKSTSKLNDLETLVRNSEQEKESMSKDCEEKLSKLQADYETVSHQVTESKVESSPDPVTLKAPRNGKKDNLTLIKGVGAILEKRLNELGVYHFDQIASWTPSQQEFMDEKMAFPGRVERENWVDQSKLLATGVETEFAKRVKDGEVPSSKKS